MAKTILFHFPPDASYKKYVEPYGGSAALMLCKPLGHVEIYNDIEQNVYCLFKVLSDEGMFKAFKRLCDLALYSEQIRDEMKVALEDSDFLSMYQRAFVFWYVNRTSYNGVGGLNVMPVIRRGMSKSTSDFLSSVDRLKELHDRLSAVIVLNQDALKLIKKHDGTNTFMYLDPPYHPDTRSSGGYKHDYTVEDHRALIELLLECKSKILLSGYDCDDYSWLAHKFKKVKFDVSSLDGKNRVKVREEVLWRNY